MSKIYVASSWRNDIQPVVVECLRGLGHEVYDFKNPREGDNGFAWADVSLKADGCNFTQYREGIDHPIAQAGYASDFDAMTLADTCVLVLPSGRSAHIEAGWMKGAGKRLAILFHGEPVVTPELMYLMADHLAPDFHSLFKWIGRVDVPAVLGVEGGMAGG